MALLSPRRTPWWWAALALVSLAGCFLLPGARGLAFSHAVHVEGEGLACVNCHEDAAVADSPGMPGPDLCVFCHDEVDAGKPVERSVEGLFAGGETFPAARLLALSDEVRFPHLRHVEAGLACDDCHAAVVAGDALAPDQGLRMASCEACHARAGVARTCATCHAEVSAERAPATHGAAWERVHGRAARFGGGATVQRCDLCHREEGCASCHALAPPTSHDEVFRTRTHGVHARVDRASCATCHEPTSCDRCHAEALPRNHRGAWGGTKSRHCVTCHLPLATTDCATCHTATPGHAGPPKPLWHTPTMNCRQCHGRGQSLPHADNGDNCNLCHP